MGPNERQRGAWPERPPTAFEFNDVLRKFPSLDLSWPAALQYRWWVTFKKLQQFAAEFDARAAALRGASPQEGRG